VIAPSASLGLVGWAVFGLGLAAVAPTVLGAASRSGDAPPAVAIAAVSSVGYLGSFVGPPAVGGLAQATSLSTALLLLVGVSLVLAVLARPALRRGPGGAGHAVDEATPGRLAADQRHGGFEPGSPSRH
jgi:MFS family permease